MSTWPEWVIDRLGSDEKTIYEIGLEAGAFVYGEHMDATDALDRLWEGLIERGQVKPGVWRLLRTGLLEGYDQAQKIESAETPA